MKKKVSILLIGMLMTFLVGCGGTEKTESKDAPTGEPVSWADFDKVYSDPDSYKNREVEFYGKVFVEPEKDSKGTYLQVFTANKGQDNNVLVGIEDTKLDVKEDDIVHIKGTVKGSESGTNAFGAEIKAPRIVASSVEKATYVEAFSPAKKTVEVNKEINQHGYILTLQKLELADDETRAYVKIKNSSSDKITFYDFNCKLTQGSTQIKQERNYDAKYPEIDGDILPGIEAEGVVSFAPAKIDGDVIKFISEGYSDNYELDFEPFTFEVSLK